jgi:hypothetical protein
MLLCILQWSKRCARFATVPPYSIPTPTSPVPVSLVFLLATIFSLFRICSATSAAPASQQYLHTNPNLSCARFPCVSLNRLFSLFCIRSGTSSTPAARPHLPSHHFFSCVALEDDCFAAAGAPTQHDFCSLTLGCVQGLCFMNETHGCCLCSVALKARARKHDHSCLHWICKQPRCLTAQCFLQHMLITVSFVKFESLKIKAFNLGWSTWLL